MRSSQTDHSEPGRRIHPTGGETAAAFLDSTYVPSFLSPLQSRKVFLSYFRAVCLILALMLSSISQMTMKTKKTDHVLHYILFDLSS